MIALALLVCKNALRCYYETLSSSRRRRAEINPRSLVGDFDDHDDRVAFNLELHGARALLGSLALALALTLAALAALIAAVLLLLARLLLGGFVLVLESGGDALLLDLSLFQKQILLLLERDEHGGNLAHGARRRERELGEVLVRVERDVEPFVGVGPRRSRGFRLSLFLRLLPFAGAGEREQVVVLLVLHLLVHHLKPRERGVLLLLRLFRVRGGLLGASLGAEGVPLGEVRRELVGGGHLRFERLGRVLALPLLARLVPRLALLLRSLPLLLLLLLEVPAPLAFAVPVRVLGFLEFGSERSNLLAPRLDDFVARVALLLELRDVGEGLIALLLGGVEFTAEAVLFRFDRRDGVVFGSKSIDDRFADSVVAGDLTLRLGVLSDSLA
mmetsp:Transcript_9778/g.44539  ORF Transcript_9778/g.44539 Transcript_9778/m.44539 type:complete len:387 (+) Transcript_9778:1240-2400(+)